MRPTIRTMTLGIGAPHPLNEETVRGAAEFLAGARAAAEGAGYTAQTTRIATRPLLEDMAAASDDEIVAYAGSLQAHCDTYEIGYCSLGPAPATDPAFPLERITLLPRLIAPHAALSATVQLATVEAGVRYEAALATAQVMRGLAEAERGRCELSLRGSGMCEPGGPFFPQAYRAGRSGVSRLACSAPGGREAIRRVRERRPECRPMRWPRCRRLAGVARGVARPGRRRCCGGWRRRRASSMVAWTSRPRRWATRASRRRWSWPVSGLFGAPGTLALAATLTAAIRGAAADVPTCGYCGLMLPVLEDETLGMRCAEGSLSVTSLLAYSAVCGTGLDTTPLPGDAPLQRSPRCWPTWPRWPGDCASRSRRASSSRRARRRAI